MMGDRELTGVTPPLDDISFLVRSPNRVAVLEALADGPYSRQILVEETLASRVTVGRVLTDFERRGWAVRTESGYEATRQGRLIARELDSFRTRLRSLGRLAPLIECLPLDRFDVPLEGFVDARVTLPTATEPNRHHQHIGLVGARADRVRMYAQGVTREALAIHRAAVEDASQRVELVLTREAMDVVRANDHLRADLHTVAREGTVGVVDESLAVPFVALFDDVGFVGADDEGVPVGVVETDNDAVVAWIRRTLDSVLAASTPIDPDSLTD